MEPNIVSLMETEESDTDLRRVASICNDIVDRQKRIKSFEKELAQMKKELERLETRDLPEAMGGLDLVRLETGEKIEIKRKLRASIKKEDQDQVFSWLDQRGHGDLIKTKLESQFGRNELSQAQAAAKLLQEQGVSVDLRQSIHWSTLDKWVNEQLAVGLELPPEITTFEITKVEIS